MTGRQLSRQTGGGGGGTHGPTWQTGGGLLFDGFGVGLVVAGGLVDVDGDGDGLVDGLVDGLGVMHRLRWPGGHGRGVFGDGLTVGLGLVDGEGLVEGLGLVEGEGETDGDTVGVAQPECAGLPPLSPTPLFRSHS